MSEKVTIQDIIEQLAEKHSMTKKEAETFVKGMFELIEEALAAEKYVKVKGLGTFKLTEVDSRESVNVNTGERIEIQGHTKISFTPDSGMKDLINKPFAHFETVVLNEHTNLEDTETEMETEGEEEDSFDENVPKPEEPVAAEEPVMVEESGLVEEPVVVEETVMVEESGLVEKPVVVEETVMVEESGLVEEPVAAEEGSVLSVETTEEKIQIIESEEKSEDIVTEAEKDIVVETAAPPTVSPLSEETSPEETTTPKETIVSEEATVSEESILSEETVPTPVSSNVEKEQKIVGTTKVQEISKEKKNRVSWGIILAVILIVCMAGGIYWYLQSDKTSDLQSPATIKNTPKQEKEEIPAIPVNGSTPVNDSLMQGKDIANTGTNAPGKETVGQSQQAVSPIAKKSSDIAKKSPGLAKTAIAKVAKETLADTVEYDITGTKTNYTLREGESLVKVAVKFYGTKRLWPYIVKHNKNIIQDADRVPIGTTLRIPELTPKK